MLLVLILCFFAVISGSPMSKIVDKTDSMDSQSDLSIEDQRVLARALNTELQMTRRLRNDLRVVFNEPKPDSLTRDPNLPSQEKINEDAMIAAFLVVFLNFACLSTIIYLVVYLVSSAFRNSDF